MSTSQAVLQHLPFLRRYARALSGSQASGDAYVAATLESLIASPKILESGPNQRVALYALFTKIWNSVGVNDKADAVDPNFLNHVTWYSATDWKRPYPGESRVEMPGPFVKAAKKYRGGDDD